MADESATLEERAKILAEATGRSYEDVLTDLADDGVLNESNKTKQDLVTQLKEAAELITTVQSINQQVTENTVLNGGENKTEVKVETTLEGDIIDRAIESAQRKADNFKKLILTLAPIFLLLTGGAGLEALGVTDMVGSKDNNYNPDTGCVSFWMYDDSSYVLDNTIYVETTFYDDNYCDTELEGHFIVSLFVDGAFSNQQNINTGYFRDYYDLSTQWVDLASGNYQIAVEFHTVECEDGTCEHGPEWESPHRPSFSIDTGTSDCVPDWWWKDEAIFDHDHNGQGFNNDLRVQGTFRALNQCNIHMNNGYFEIMVGDDSRILEYNFHDEFAINEHYLDLAPGDYYVTVDYYTYDGSSWSGPTAWVTMESEPTCATDLIHKDAELYLINGNELEVAMIIQSNNDCEDDIDFMFSLYHNDTYQSTIDYGVLPVFTVSGTGEYRITLAHSDWKNLGEGLWNLETRFNTESDGEVCCIMTNKIEIKND